MRWPTRIALAALGALIVALGVAWFLHTHERVADTVDLPQRGEAAYNPLYALRETLRADGVEAIGPHLDGVVGRQKASVDGFAYSGALRAMEGEEWTPERLDAFLRNPRGYAPGTKMAFAGLRDAQDRADVIAYLQANP